MDRGTWRATFHGVAKSRTQLSNSNTHTHTHPSPPKQADSLLILGSQSLILEESLIRPEFFRMKLLGGHAISLITQPP